MDWQGWLWTVSGWALWGIFGACMALWAKSIRDDFKGGGD